MMYPKNMDYKEHMKCEKHYKDMGKGDSIISEVKRTQKHPISEVKTVSIEDYKKKKMKY